VSFKNLSGGGSGALEEGSARVTLAGVLACGGSAEHRIQDGASAVVVSAVGVGNNVNGDGSKLVRDSATRLMINIKNISLKK